MWSSDKKPSAEAPGPAPPHRVGPPSFTIEAYHYARKIGKSLKKIGLIPPFENVSFFLRVRFLPGVFGGIGRCLSKHKEHLEDTTLFIVTTETTAEMIGCTIQMCVQHVLVY